MKRAMIYLVAVLLTVVCVVTIADAKDFKTATDIQIYMRENFIYGQDVQIENYFEYFQLPSILEFSKLGDCDDFATYSYSYLQKLNIISQRYILYILVDNKPMGHAITVFLDTDNTYSIFTNQYILKTHETTPLDAIKNNTSDDNGGLVTYKKWLIICEWHPRKYGRVTFEDFKKDIVFKDAITIKQYIAWIININKSSIER